MYLVIGSGDTTKLLSGKKTKGFRELIEKFIAENPPYYNSFASPIDALRTGAILERRYLLCLKDDYYFQYKKNSNEFDCLCSTIDFAKFSKGELVDFDELKTIHFTNFIESIVPLSQMELEEQNKLLKKMFKSNYNQLQFQLFCTGLNSANLVFLAVHNYNDEDNIFREITENDFIKFRVNRDENVINQIKERAKLFQSIKDYINN